MRTIKAILLIVVFSLFFLNQSIADVKLPRIFSSNMVLQKGIEIPVWGWADKGEQITVILNNKSVRTKTDGNGKWKVKLPVQEYGGPHKLIVKGKNTIELENILIGEVWVCSGQSNMEWGVVQSVNGEKEVASANFNKIRLFTVPKPWHNIRKMIFHRVSGWNARRKQWVISQRWVTFLAAIFSVS
jgi:sialate O-acetylesterase